MFAFILAPIKNLKFLTSADNVSIYRLSPLKKYLLPYQFLLPKKYPPVYLLFFNFMYNVIAFETYHYFGGR
jgi:hypothetical protein